MYWNFVAIDGVIKNKQLEPSSIDPWGETRRIFGNVTEAKLLTDTLPGAWCQAVPYIFQIKLTFLRNATKIFEVIFSPNPITYGYRLQISLYSTMKTEAWVSLEIFAIICEITRRSIPEDRMITACKI
jgi:hypothetical protein